MINPIYIRTFISLCQTQHFTKTAELLGMTQPGVSQHLMKLETELDCILFQRRGKKIELTIEGQKFLKYAQNQLVAENELRSNLMEDFPFKGACKISCSGSLVTYLYPTLLKLQKQHSDLRFIMEAAPNHVTIAQVKGNEYDIGLVTHHPDDPELNTISVGSEDLCLVVPKGFQFSWDNLMDLGYINHPNGAHYANQVLEENFPSTFTGFSDIPISGYINQLNQILIPVSMGLGFTILPRTTIEKHDASTKIELAPLKHAFQETIYLISKKYKELPARYTQIKSIIEDQLNNKKAL
ncbi:LysR family transcriptional regulator [Curvivirga sp.]|uniref:LysR family transcriptional regulator n=1 Tax=Curvivirga sp. TaxID=2856848 RepID=UPI003B5C1203